MQTDALYSGARRAVSAMGGAKKVGTAIWPAKDMKAAAQRINDITNEDCPDKFSLEELAVFLRMAGEVGHHEFMELISEQCGYRVTPIGSDEEQGGPLERIVSVLEQIEGRAARMEGALTQVFGNPLVKALTR